MIRRFQEKVKRKFKGKGKEREYRLFLEKLPMFNNLKEAQLEEFVSKITPKNYLPKVELLTQGKRTKGVFFLRQGEVRIIKARGSTGDQQFLEQGSVGDLFGVISSLGGSKIELESVETIGQCQFLFVRQQDFINLVTKFNLWSYFVEDLSRSIELAEHGTSEILSYFSYGMVQIDREGKLIRQNSPEILKVLGIQEGKIQGEKFSQLFFSDGSQERRQWEEIFSQIITVSSHKEKLNLIKKLPKEYKLQNEAEINRSFKMHYNLSFMGENTTKIDVIIEEIPVLEGVGSKQSLSFKEPNQKVVTKERFSSRKFIDGLEDELGQIAKVDSKKIKFKMKGGAISLPADLYLKAELPLRQLLRNAADHGIETVGIRRKAGKKPIGTIEFQAYQQADGYHLMIQDDGRGIEIEQIVEKARKKMQSDTPLKGKIKKLFEENRILDLVFLEGMGTNRSNNKVLEKGIGLNFLNRTINEAGGRLSVATDYNRGTKFTMSFPKNLYS